MQLETDRLLPTMDSLWRKINFEPLREILPSITNNRSLLPILAGLGAFYTLKQISGLSAFFYTQLLRPSSLQRYNSGSDGKSPASWALVTGASDGIGKGFAEELCNRGFNIILHGRNETKLNAVRQELLKQWPKLEIKILIFDVVNDTGDTAKLEAAAAKLKGLDLRVLVNNVGGGAGIRPVYVPLHERDAAMTNLFIDLNLRFPTQITRLLLPQLIQHEPACILNIGSLASESVAPYACIYSGSKAYNKSWSASLDAELKAEGHDVEVKLIQTGMVSTGSEPREVTLSIPSSRTFAKHSLDKVGDGNRYVHGYWVHELQNNFLLSLPRSMAEKLLVYVIGKEREKEMAMLKAK